MTPGQWADVFLAGRRAIPDNGGTPAQVLSAVLLAMSHKAGMIADETAVNHPPTAAGLTVRPEPESGGVTLPRDTHGLPTVPLPYGERCHCDDLTAIAVTVGGPPYCQVCGGRLGG